MLNKYNLLPDDAKRLQFYAALARLKDDKDFRLFIEILAQTQDSIDQSNRIVQAPELQWGQGAAQLLERLLGMIEQSTSLRDQMRKQAEEKETPRQNGF